MTKNSKLLKNIISISLMIVLLLGSIFSFTFAYFSDKKENTIVINPATMKTTIVTEKLNPEDLIAGSIFQKNLDLTFTGGFDLYFRTYAEIVVETYNDSKTVENRTDLINVLYVNQCVQGEDTKFYYAYSNNILKSQPVYISPTAAGFKVFLNYSFKVDNSINENMFTDVNNNYDSSLKATITYYIEYIQKEGFTDWSGFGVGVDTSNYLYGNTTVSGTPSETTPVTFTHVGELITESNYTTFGVNENHIGKYAVPVNFPASKNLFNPVGLNKSASGGVITCTANDSQIVTINCTTATAGGLISLYTLTEPIPAGTEVAFSVEVVGGIIENSAQFSVGGYCFNEGQRSWQTYVCNLTGKVEAGVKSGGAFTTTNELTDVVLFLNTGSEHLTDNLQLKIMLSVADAVTEWVPFKAAETKYAILNEPLRSVSNSNGTSTYADYIDFKNGIVVRKTNSLVVTSDNSKLNFSLFNKQNNGTFSFYISSLELLGPYNTSLPNNGGLFINYHGLSTHFVMNSAYSGSTPGFSTSFSSAPPYICIRITGEQSIDVAKAYFTEQANNGTPVEFILAYYTPKIEKLTLI